MIGFVLALAVLNVAAISSCWLLYYVWFVQPPPVPVATDFDDEGCEQGEVASKPRLNLPAAWAKQLMRLHVTVHSVVEGGVRIAELDLDRFESELEEIARPVASAVEAGDDLELASLASRFQTLLEQRLPEVESTAEHLENRKDEDIELRRLSNQLAEALNDELAELSDAIHKTSQLNFARDAKQAGEQLSSEVDHMLQVAGELRELLDSLLNEVRGKDDEEEDELDLADSARFATLHREGDDGVLQTSVVERDASSA